jgi:hypothetical protein
MEKYIDKLNWNTLCHYYQLSEQFMDKYSDKLNWDYLCKYQTLSEQFMDKYSNKLNWNCVCKYQTLSEQFMDKYSNKLNWDCVCKCQKLSEEFMEKYIDKLDWNTVSYKYKFKNKLFEKYVKKEHNWIYMDEKLKIEKIKKYYKIKEKNGIKYVECYIQVGEDYSDSYRVYDKLNYEYKTDCDYNELTLCHELHDTFTGFSSNSFEFIKFIKKLPLSEKYKIIKCLVPIDSMCMTSYGYGDDQIRSSILIVTEVL